MVEKTKIKHINVRALQITIGVLLLLFGFGLNNSIKNSEADLLQRMRHHNIPDSSKVIIATIDNSSLDYVRKNTGYSYPWPRDFYAHIVDYLTTEGSKAILFDILFHDRSRESSEAVGGEYDSILANSIRKHGNVYIATQLSKEEKETEAPLDQYSKIESNLNNYPEFYSVNMPTDTLYNAVTGTVAINVQSDEDGILRKIPVYNVLKSGGQSYMIPSYPIKLVENQIGVDQIMAIPLTDGLYHLNWYNEEFIYCPIKAVLQSSIAMKYGGEATIPSGYFKDAIVMIGATADGLNNIKHTPVGSQRPGIEAWATLYTNLITNDHVRFLSPFLTVILTSLFLFALVFITNREGFVKTLFISISITLLTIAIFYLIWIKLCLVMPIMLVIFTYLCYTLSYIFLSFAKEYNERLRIRNMFSRYISKEILKELEKNPNLIDLGGEEVEAAVMFSDIYDFTSIAEKTNPKKLVENLNAYFTVMSEFITGNKGLLEAYLGDGILAVFGIPVQPSNSSEYVLNACKMALEHNKYNKRIIEKKDINPVEELHLNTRIGIATGSVIAGNIGSPTRMDYTVIGDPVNVASRLESINKYYKTNIIICENVHRLATNDFICRKLDRIRLKGKSKAVTIYELIDNKSIDFQDEYKWIKDYEEALKLYFNSEFHKASYIFKRLSNSINDKPSRIMLNRCESLINSPPGEWDGIYTMEVK